MLESVTNAATWAAHAATAAATPFVFALPAAALSPVVLSAAAAATAAYALSHRSEREGFKLLVQAEVKTEEEKDVDGKVTKAAEVTVKEESYTFNTEKEAWEKLAALKEANQKAIDALTAKSDAQDADAEETKQPTPEESAKQAEELAKLEAYKALLETANIEASTQRGWDLQGSAYTLAATFTLATAAAASFAVAAPASAMFFAGLLTAAAVAQASAYVLGAKGHNQAASVASAVATTAVAAALFGLPCAGVVAALELVAGAADWLGAKSVGSAAHATNEFFAAPVKSFADAVKASCNRECVSVAR